MYSKYIENNQHISVLPLTFICADMFTGTVVNFQFSSRNQK